MHCSAKRYRSRTSTVLLLAMAVAVCLASLARPGVARAADTKPAAPAATATPGKTAATAPVDKKAAKAKLEADKKAKQEADKIKQKAARDKQDQEDIAAKHPWVRGANWLTFRAGVAAASHAGRPNPGPGVGFGMQHFMNRRWALAAQLDYDLLGKYGGAAEMEVPLHLEATRHFDWGEQMRPYLGMSAGATWHRTYRTGEDEASIRPSLFIVGGANLPIGPRSLMGADLRVGWETDARSTDPVFPVDSNSLLTWRAKITYIRWQ